MGAIIITNISKTGISKQLCPHCVLQHTMMASVISQYFASLVPRDAQHNPDSVKLTEFNTFSTLSYSLQEF